MRNLDEKTDEKKAASAKKVVLNVEIAHVDEALHKVQVLKQKIKEAKSLADDLTSIVNQLEVEIQG